MTNGRGWGELQLDDLLEVLYRYPTFYGVDYVPNSGVPVARISNILPTNVLDEDLENYVRVPSEFSARFPKTVLEPDDLVMAVRGDTTGKIARVPNSLAGSNISPNLIRMKVKRSVVTSDYLLWTLVLAPGLIQRYVTDTAKKSVTAKNIGAIRIPVPPLAIQDKFGQSLRSIHLLHQKSVISAVRLDGLFATLQERAFSDGLATSRLDANEDVRGIDDDLQLSLSNA